MYPSSFDAAFHPKHGIRPDVAEARRYVRWTGCLDCMENLAAERIPGRDTGTYWPASEDFKRLHDHCGDTEAVLRDAYPDVNHGSLNALIAAARQADGRVMYRYAPGGIDEALPSDTVHPEIRPDRAVHMQALPEWHWHGWGAAPGTAKPWEIGSIYSAAQMYRHIHSDSSKDPHSHGDKNPGGWHMHWDRAKYLFVPSKKVRPSYWHTHAAEFILMDVPFDAAAQARADDARERHEAQAHKSEWPNVPGRFRHEHRAQARIDPTAPSNARRIDVHPFAMERLDRAEVIFAVLEGIPKNDAVLSYILDHGLNASVFNVPSVSLWNASELPAFAERYLVGKTVVIVPDADWQKSPKARFKGRRFGAGNQVIIQALLFRSKLRQLGVRDVLIAAPPVGDWLANADHKGVDDSLASPEHGGAGRSLADLEVLQRTVPERRISGLGRLHWHGRRQDRNEQVLRFLAEHADRDGVICLTQTSIAAGLDPEKPWHHERVRNALADLIEVGAIEQQGEFSDAKGKHGDELRDNLPVIALAPEYAAVQADPDPLGWFVDIFVGKGGKASTAA